MVVCRCFCAVSDFAWFSQTCSAYGSRLLSSKKLRKAVEQSDPELFPFLCTWSSEAGMACRVHAVLYEAKVCLKFKHVLECLGDR